MPPLNTPEKPEFPTDETLGERLTTVAFYTAISVSMSLCITLAILYLSGHGMHRITIIISIVAPGIIAPLVTWYVSDLLVRIARMATFDELTGLLSRRAFLEQSDALLKLCQRQNQHATFVMLDLDKFKAINDQYGHGGGDLVLREFANLIRESVRKSDLAGRIGGEEFAIFMPGTSQEAALPLLEKLRNRTENLTIHYHGETIRASISMGVSDTCTADIDSISSLSRVSDEALYSAKSAGGNRVVSATIVN
tara:strand:+ start:75003 stop:75758 length:756 start_codon:yes stop_codon:yes gene_type:complete